LDNIGTRTGVGRVNTRGAAFGMTRLRVIPGGRSASDRFVALVGPHFDTLYRTAYRWTRAAHDAEDLVQDLCVRAYPRLRELELLDDVRGWLLCVMYRLFVDSTRRYERTHVRSIDSEAGADFVSHEPTPEEQADSAIAQRRLSLAWRHIAKDQRALLALHDIEGYTLAELEEMTGLKQGTLKSRLHRTRVRLGRLLEREEARDRGGLDDEMRRRNRSAR
jgi:RNA polymerase sigma factor (sigma-70 family)